MSNTRAAHRYALALIEAASEASSLDAVSGDLDLLGRLIASSPDFRAFLRSPIVTNEKKKQILTEILKNKINTLTLQFLLMTAAKNREGLLPEIIRQFTLLRDERLGILNVAVQSAVAMTGEQEKTLSRQLAKVTGKKIRMTSVIDKSLRGGFTVQYDDTVWDASVRRQLENLRLRFAAGT